MSRVLRSRRPARLSVLLLAALPALAFACAAPPAPDPHRAVEVPVGAPVTETETETAAAPSEPTTFPAGAPEVGTEHVIAFDETVSTEVTPAWRHDLAQSTRAQRVAIHVETTSAPPATGEGTIGCKVENVDVSNPRFPPSQLPPEAAKVHAEWLARDVAGLSCSFRRTPYGRLDGITLVTPDAMTGSDANAGDGLLVDMGHWAIGLRLALRVASVPFPEHALTPGESWTVDETATVDGVPTHRRATYTLVAWTGHGARVKVDLDEQVAKSGRHAATKELVTGHLHARGELVVDSRRALPRGRLALTSDSDTPFKLAFGSGVRFLSTRKGTLTFR